MKKDDNFIMLPTVDFCLKELMNNSKVRKGFIAAILRKDPKEIKETILMPTILRREYEDDKFGILDVRVKLQDGTQMDIEMQVEYFAYWDRRVLFYISKMYTEQLQKGDEYKKLKKCIHVSILDFVYFPEDNRCYRTIRLCDCETGKVYTDIFELQILELPKLCENEGESSILKWMRFLSGKSREEFEEMAKADEYLEEAYDTLLKLSADEIKRLEYEAREKAIRDYISQMDSAMERGIDLSKKVFKLYLQGKTNEEIAEQLELSIDKVKEILE